MTKKISIVQGRPSAGSTENKGYQPSRTPISGGKENVQGGYQGPTSEGAPANAPSGGSSGGKK